MEALVRWRPGPDDVGVDVTEDGRLQHWLQARLVAPGDQKHPPRGWVKLADLRKQLRSGRTRQPLAGENETDLAPGFAEAAEDLKRRLDRAGRDDLVVSPVALAQLRLDALMRSRVIGQQQNRFQSRASDLGK